MGKLTDLLDRERRLLSQERELRDLREQLRKQQEQNARMREGMRRCTTCEYRIEVVARRDAEGQ